MIVCRGYGLTVDFLTPISTYGYGYAVLIPGEIIYTIGSTKRRAIVSAENRNCEIDFENRISQFTKDAKYKPTR